MRKIIKKIRKSVENHPEAQWFERVKIKSARRQIRNGRRHGSLGNKKLFIDITVIAANDAGTGIQRVVRGIASQYDTFCSAGWDVYFVVATRTHQYHRISWPHEGSVSDKTPIKGGKGDVFLGLDYSLDAVRFHENQIRALASSGVRVMFLIHDLLPINKPEWFPPLTANRFRKWLRILASLSDVVLCNSKQTQHDYETAIATHFNVSTPSVTHVIPMGIDVAGSMHSKGHSDHLDHWLHGLSAPSLLTVSTLEPRKGHSDLIDAFSKLWEQGYNYNLILVGRAGWKVDELIAKLTNHPELNQRLHWLNDISDETLIQLYEQCMGMIIPSLAEGYGLPLVEAVNYGKPVLARDIAVFREHEAYGVEYFPENATATIFAECIAAWATRIQHDEIKIVRPIGRTWKHSAEYMLQVLSEEPSISKSPL